ncbi:MAG: autotransporter-associated beta strand repeat-containing protein, partial [Verrucomicrobia bacterium]|nr:autotransporter-associated beta strand repeat-containing protein [Verrucomicrobiota bacterium]
TYTGGTTLLAGTLQLGHVNALGTGVLSITGASTLQATVNLSAGGTGPLPNALSLGGALTVSGSNSISFNGTFTGTAGDASRTLTNSLTAGTLVIDSATATIGATANTAARTLTIDGTGNTTFTNALGNGVFAGNALAKSGTGTLTFNGLSATAANNYGGVTTLNAGTMVINNTSPSLAGGLTFGAAATTTPAALDLNGVSATFGGALTMNINSATASTITVDAGQSLTVNNNVQIGATTPAVANTVTNLTLNGGGSFNVTTAAAGTFTVGGSTSTTIAQTTTLDLTALASANINTSTTGTFRVSPGTATNLSNSRATLLLPTPAVADTVATTTITAGTISVGNFGSFNSNAGQINTITLGTGLTTLNANTINVGTGARDIGQINFAGVDGDLIIRAADGTSRATAINVGTGGAGTGTTEATTNNLVNLSGHDANILITTLNVGNQSRLGGLTSEFNFGADDASISSVLDATNVNIGFRTGTATATSTLTNRVNISGGAVTFGNVGATGTGVDIGNSTYNQAGAASTVGELNISGGSVTINNSTSLAAAVRLGTNAAAGGGTVTAALNITGGTTTLAGNIIRNATSPRTTSTVLLNGSSAILNMGGFSIGSGSAVITLGAQAGTLQNLGELNGGGDLTKTTAGTLILSGTNTYTGTTQINAGTVELTGGSAILNSGVVALADVAGANLQLNASETIGSLSGGGATGGNVNLQSNTLTLSAASGSTAYAGIISGSGGSLVKAGGGTQVLSGVNTFTGKTTIANGTLSIASIDSVATNAQPLGTNADLDLGVAATSSARLLYTGAATTLSKNINVLGNGTDTIENAGSGLLTLTGTITKAGTTLTLNGGSSGLYVGGLIVGVPVASDLIIAGGTVTLAGANTYNGPTFLNAGTLNINNASAISTGAFTINGGTIDNTSGAAITLTTNNPLNINSNFSFTGTHSLNLGTGAVTLDANRTVTVSANTLTIGGAIGGAFNLTGAGAGTLLLTGASTYTGTTTAQTGTTISVGANGSLGDISSGTVVDNGASLALNSVLYTDAEALTINGTGVGGAGALQTTGTSSFAGPITAATNATINNTGTLGLTGGLVKDATTLTLAGSGTYNISGIGISGARANSDLIVSAATVNLNVANTYNGPTFVRNGGTINANVANALPTAIARTAIIMDDTGSGSSTLALGSAQSAASLTGAATSQINVGASQLTVGAASGSTNFAGTIVGTGGSIVKDGASTQTLSGANTYSGGTTVNDGTLNVTNTTGSATGSGTVTVGTSGTLAGTGTVEAAANNYIYINGTLQVGDSTLGVPVASTLEVKTSGTGSMVLGAASIVKFDLFSGAGLGDNTAISTAADQIRLFGSLDAATTPGSTLLLAYVGAGSFMAGDMWKLFDLTGPGTISGAFNINYSGLGLGPLLAAELNHSTGILSIVTVPEPSRALLYMIGLMGIFLRRRRR